MTRTILGALPASGMLLLAACSPGEELTEQIAGSQEGVGDVEIDENSGEVSVESDEGSATFGGGELPDDFPIDMPEGGEVQSVIEQEDAVIVSVSCTDDFSAIADHFQGWIDDNSLEVINRFESSDPQSSTWSVEDDDRAYNITVAPADETVQVTIMTGGN